MKRRHVRARRNSDSAMDVSADEGNTSANEDELDRFLAHTHKAQRTGSMSNGGGGALLLDARTARRELGERIDRLILAPLRLRNDHNVLGVAAHDDAVYRSPFYERLQCTMALVHYFVQCKPAAPLLATGDGFQAALNLACVFSQAPASARVPLTLGAMVALWQRRFAITFVAALVTATPVDAVPKVLLLFEWHDDGRVAGAGITLAVVTELAPACSTAVRGAVFSDTLGQTAGPTCELFPRAFVYRDDADAGDLTEARVSTFGVNECSTTAAAALAEHARLFYVNYAYVTEEVLTLIGRQSQ